MAEFKQTSQQNKIKNHRLIAMVFGFLFIAAIAGLFLYQKHSASSAFSAFKDPSSQQTSTAQSLALPKSDPKIILIPKISVDANMVPLGLQSNGSIEVPKNGGDVGWYIYGPTPGEIGPAVVVGHLDTVNGKAVFYKLSSLKPGDEVSIQRQDGKTAIFTVTGSEKYSQNNFPSEKVYGQIDYAGLRLITCNGTYIKSAGHYSDNLVVYAILSKVE